MPLVPITELVDKTLIARRPVNIYASIYGDPVAQAKSGQTIGVVYSWVGGTEGKPIFLQFYTPARQPYYVKFESGAFNYDLLREQGVQTTQEILEQQQEENKPLSTKIMDTVTKLFLWGGVIYLGSTFIKSRGNSSK